jgi:di/tricarboxylate transporter
MSKLLNFIRWLALIPVALSISVFLNFIIFEESLNIFSIMIFNTLSGFVFVWIGYLIAPSNKEKVTHYLLMLAILQLVITLLLGKWMFSVENVFFIIGATWKAFDVHRKIHFKKEV